MYENIFINMATENSELSEVSVSDEESIEEVNNPSRSRVNLKEKTKALVWKYFGFEAKDDGHPYSLDTPTCSVGVKDANTTNLYSHLKIKHPEEFALAQCTNSNQGKTQKERRMPNQPSLSETWNKQKKLSSDSREHKELTKSVTCCLARDMFPLSTVDKPGFHAMFQKFNPRYQLPTHKYFTKVAIPRLVSEVRGNIECQIASRELEYFSATTDLWTSGSGDPNLPLQLKSLHLQTHKIIYFRDACRNFTTMEVRRQQIGRNNNR